MTSSCPPTVFILFSFSFSQLIPTLANCSEVWLDAAADIIFPFPLSFSLSEIASPSSLRRDANFASLSYEQSLADFSEVLRIRNPALDPKSILVFWMATLEDTL